MAAILPGSGARIFQLKDFLGLNECPDGDVGLKLGEASVMRNFRVTREGNLQTRPGYQLRHTLGDGPVRCLWSGYVAGEPALLAVCSGALWWVDGEAPVSCGTVNDGDASMFGFGGKAYLLAGGGYYSWDGSSLAQVEGYVPLVAVASSPEGNGSSLEPVNRLTGKRRQRFSPDGSAVTFHLAESGLAAVLSVERGDGLSLPPWTANPAAGTVTFSSAPERGVDCITVTYDAGAHDRASVTAMRFAEIYGGASDSRVFLYGDGSFRAIYSELDGDGLPSAEYFPELNVLSAGTSNTPITGLLRHFSRMLVFKSDGAWSASASTVTLTDGSVSAAFYLTPIQRNAGNAAPGQARLVYNNPRTVSGGAVYEWRSSGGALVSSDERTLKRLSQRVETTLQTWDLSRCVTFDDEYSMEWYLIHGDAALVHNYENDAWYYYDNLPAACMARHGQEVFFGTPDGRLMHFSRLFRNDNGAELDAYWESGAMDFSRDWQRKYSANMWVSIKPESQGRVNVTMRSNRKSDYAEKTVASSLATFSHVDFSHFSFATNREPQVKRVRIKVKKFTFSTLILSSRSASASATVLGVDFKLRYTGNVKQR